MSDGVGGSGGPFIGPIGGSQGPHKSSADPTDGPSKSAPAEPTEEPVTVLALKDQSLSVGVDGLLTPSTHQLTISTHVPDSSKEALAALPVGGAAVD